MSSAREPDPEALASYAQSLAAKRDVSALLNEILRSQEFREKSLAALAPELVQATYQGLLERAPEPKALTSYSQSLAARRNLGALLSEIIHSQEFHEKALAALAPELVRAAFQGVLGREPEPKALASYAESLAAKSNLGGLLTELVRSNEFRGKQWSRARDRWPHPSATYDSPAVIFLHVQKTAGTSMP